MKLNKFILILSAVTSIFVTNLTSPVVAQTNNNNVRNVTNSHNYTVQWTNDDFGDYYESIDFTSYSTLKEQLQSLNSSKRTRTVGYSNMWNYFDQTDYHPSNTSKYVAFYQGTAASKGDMNKEHVWPKSHGSGGRTDADIHMVRPTLSADNSSRGNSFYVEGMNHSSQGWDPKTAGMNEQYRGQAARIIFYCVIADSKLSLVDTNYSSTSNANPDYKMGKLSDLLKWNLEYAVDITELNRNSGAEDIQGNRNPFIDNPYLACAIWGNYNDTTRQICADYNVIVDPYTGDITLPDYSGSTGDSDSDDSSSDTDSGTTTPINYGTLTDPLSISEVKTICDNLSSGTYSSQKGYVSGVVKTEPTLNSHGSYEFYLDGGSTEFMVYSAKLASGVTVPKIGDTVVVNGYFKKYNDIYEVAYISALNDSPYIVSVDASGDSSTSDTPSTPDIPSTPSSGVETSSISFDFNSAGIASTAYASDVTVTIDNKKYYFSDIYVGDNGGSSVVRLGKKGSTAIQDLGLSGSGSYLRPEFDIENCSSISLEIQNTYSNTDGYKILFKESNSSSYTTVKEGTLSGATTLEATLSSPKTGRFIVVITGSQARADLGKFEIKTKPTSSSGGTTTTPDSSIDLSSLSLNTSVTDDKLKFIAEFDKSKLSSATKVGILVFSKNQLNNKKIEDLYTSGNLSSFKSSINKYDYLDFDFTSIKVEQNNKYLFGAVISNVKGHEDYKFVAVAYAEINGELYFTNQIIKSYNDCK